VSCVPSEICGIGKSFQKLIPVREHNMIRFKAGKPTGIWFSQHKFGLACSWADEICFSKKGDRVCLLPYMLCEFRNGY